MTSHVGRLYALALALLVFFVAWSVFAARPWVSSAQADPRVVALAAREQRIRHESLVVRRIVQKRWVAYRSALKRRRKLIAARQAQLAAAPVAGPSVQVVNLPPLTVTRTS
jgi:hypothetical protein